MWWGLSLDLNQSLAAWKKVQDKKKGKGVVVNGRRGMDVFFFYTEEETFEEEEVNWTLDMIDAME